MADIHAIYFILIYTMIEINTNNIQKGERIITVKATAKRREHKRKIKTAKEADAEMDAQMITLRNYKAAAMRTEDWMDNHPEMKQAAGEVNNFTVEDYDRINAALRNKSTDEELSEMNIDNQIKSISSFLEGAPKFNGVVYRGMGFDPNVSKEKIIYDNFMDNVRNNKFITLPSFTSTTCEKEIAMNFSGEGVPRYSARIILEIKSKRGVALNGVAAFPKEMEVLFDKSSNFKVIGIKEINGIQNIKLEEI